VHWTVSLLKRAMVYINAISLSHRIYHHNFQLQDFLGIDVTGFDYEHYRYSLTIVT
jgi:hypothetical protein